MTDKLPILSGKEVVKALGKFYLQMTESVLGSMFKFVSVKFQYW
jgi:hypothetical protein